jgi:hypothetical protein
LAAVLAQVALDTARTLLNDDAGTLFTNAVLMPKLIQAFRQMVASLRINAADLIITTANSNLAASTASLTFSDINEPIKLWEKAQGSTDDTYLPMTEYDPLPNDVPAATIKYWQWDGTQINFIAATATRTVRTRYWRVLTEPVDGTSSLLFINAEYYLAPMTAAIMAGTLGEDEQMTTLAAQAVTTFKMIVDANRGRQAPPDSSRP